MVSAINDMPVTSVAAKIAAVHRRYDAARKQLFESESVELQQLQQECGAEGHRWKLSQVAGNGKFCEICDLCDQSDD